MYLGHHPEVLEQLVQQRQEGLIREAERERLLRANKYSGAYVERLAHRLGGVLCAWGNRLQNRHMVLGE